MFSDDRVQRLAKQFVCVKVDPRDRSADREALEYKSTRYVPEVVFLSSSGKDLGSMEDRTVQGAVAAMEEALQAAKR